VEAKTEAATIAKTGQQRLNPPSQLNIRNEARHINEVERALANNLVSDADLAASRITRLRLHSG